LRHSVVTQLFVFGSQILLLIHDTVRMFHFIQCQNGQPDPWPCTGNSYMHISEQSSSIYWQKLLT